MSLESRFAPPTPREEPQPATTCAVCGSELYYGDEVYIFWDFAQNEMLCDQCGPDAILDYYEPQHRETLTEEHI